MMNDHPISKMLFDMFLAMTRRMRSQGWTPYVLTLHVDHPDTSEGTSERQVLEALEALYAGLNAELTLNSTTMSSRRPHNPVWIVVLDAAEQAGEWRRGDAKRRQCTICSVLAFLPPPSNERGMETLRLWRADTLDTAGLISRCSFTRVTCSSTEAVRGALGTLLTSAGTTKLHVLDGTQHGWSLARSKNPQTVSAAVVKASAVRKVSRRSKQRVEGHESGSKAH